RRWRCRNATIAAERASCGSFFDDFVESSTRTLADNVGGTSTTSSPAATSCCARRYPSPDADSIAHRRCGNRSAQSNNTSHCLADDPTLNPSSPFSSRSTATAVCDPLCGSTPIVTTVITLVPFSSWGPATGTPDDNCAFASYEPRRGQRHQRRGCSLNSQTRS